MVEFHYFGGIDWRTSISLADLIEPAPGGLERYRPELHYLLLEEARYTEIELAPLQNLAAALFRLENSPGPLEFGQVVDALIAWLKMPEQDSLARAFLTWIKRVFLPSRLPGTDIPAVHTLAEVKAMLAEETIAWTRQWKQQGREEGRQWVRHGFSLLGQRGVARSAGVVRLCREACRAHPLNNVIG